MRLMRLIGYWIRSLDDDEFPPPQELVTPWDTDLQRKVVDYLDSGTVLTQFRGLTWCRFFCDKPMGSRELTDGTWVWPEDLSHYVRDHNVQLPMEFINSACCDVSDDVDTFDILARRGTDSSYWISWCTEHRSNALRSKIQAARSKAATKSKRLRDFVTGRLERSAGVSTKRCRDDDCMKPALAGCRYCLNCYIETELSWRIRRPFGNLTVLKEG